MTVRDEELLAGFGNAVEGRDARARGAQRTRPKAIPHDVAQNDGLSLQRNRGSELRADAVQSGFRNGEPDQFTRLERRVIADARPGLQSIGEAARDAQRRSFDGTQALEQRGHTGQE